MKYHIPYYYKNFVCLGGECPDTCCGGWRVGIDGGSLRRYRQVQGAFGERLRRGIDPIARCFRMKGRYCEFLNEQGLCDIFRELGKDGLCRACRDYPRHREDYGELQEIMLSMSCPEAARLILEDGSQGAGFEYVPDCKAGRGGKDRHVPDHGEESGGAFNHDAGKERENETISDGRERKRAESQEDSETAQMLSWLTELRETLICLVRDRSVDWDQRMAMVLAFGHDFERHWDAVRAESQGTARIRGRRAAEIGFHTKGLEHRRARRVLHRLSKRYLSGHAAALFAERLSPYRGRHAERMIRMAAWMRRIQKFEPVLEGWSGSQESVCRALYHKETPESYETLLKEFGREAAAFEQEWENLVLYYLRTWLLGALYDDDVYGKIEMAVFSYAVVREWCLFRYRKTGKVTIEDLTAASYRYSREIENSDANLNALEEMLGEDPLFSLESMLKAVC